MRLAVFQAITEGDIKKVGRVFVGDTFIDP